VITKEFLDKRARFPRNELEAHRGHWVAFSKDDCRIVASAVTYEAVEAQLEAVGVDGQDVAFEWVPGPDEDCKLGAEEWQ
jgi:hypothetical protein